jgi:hypothetical protein
MRTGRGNRSTRRKPAPVPLYPLQMPHDLTWDRTWVAVVGRRRLTAWAIARPTGVIWTITKKFWEKLIAYFPWYDTGHIENDASNNSSIVACVFVAAIMFLPRGWLATIRKYLPSRCLATIEGYTYKHTDRWEGFINEAVEMGSGALMYVPSFIKIGSGIQKLIGGINTHTNAQTATWSHKPNLFFQNKESRLKNKLVTPGFELGGINCFNPVWYRMLRRRKYCLSPMSLEMIKI